MNQNVFGVMLFSLIVGSAIFISEYFVPLPSPMPVYEKPVTVKNTEFSCRKQSRTVTDQPVAGNLQLKITQAVLNQRTNQLTTDFLIKRDHSQTETNSVALHFFVKDGRSTQYLATEMIRFKPNFDESGKALFHGVSTFPWLDDLNQGDNLYIIAEPTLNYNRSKNLEPVFNGSNATAVLVMPEK